MGEEAGSDTVDHPRERASTARTTQTLRENDPDPRPTNQAPQRGIFRLPQAFGPSATRLAVGRHPDGAKAAYAAGSHYLLGVRPPRNPLACEKSAEALEGNDSKES